jgi:hypothetical protein
VIAGLVLMVIYWLFKTGAAWWIIGGIILLSIFLAYS